MESRPDLAISQEADSTITNPNTPQPAPLREPCRYTREEQAYLNILIEAKETGKIFIYCPPQSLSCDGSAATAETVLILANSTLIRGVKIKMSLDVEEVSGA